MGGSARSDAPWPAHTQSMQNWAASGARSASVGVGISGKPTASVWLEEGAARAHLADAAFRVKGAHIAQHLAVCVCLAHALCHLSVKLRKRGGQRR